ncbi:MAG TPA: carbon storage regulator [Pirellulales bacterium]|jgi:carbon storage regulator|nr:carbon storage regulator [Pirellulales bacterium]
MLVLTRKIGEEVLIGDAIRVCVLEVQGNRVKLGFVAPNDIRFKRSELADAPAPRRRLVGSCPQLAGP